MILTSCWCTSTSKDTSVVGDTVDSEDNIFRADAVWSKMEVTHVSDIEVKSHTGAVCQAGSPTCLHSGSAGYLCATQCLGTLDDCEAVLAWGA